VSKLGRGEPAQLQPARRINTSHKRYGSRTRSGILHMHTSDCAHSPTKLLSPIIIHQNCKVLGFCAKIACSTEWGVLTNLGSVAQARQSVFSCCLNFEPGPTKQSTTFPPKEIFTTRSRNSSSSVVSLSKSTTNTCIRRSAGTAKHLSAQRRDGPNCRNVSIQHLAKGHVCHLARGVINHAWVSWIIHNLRPVATNTVTAH